MGEFNIMSVKEMIDRTFGDPKENTVDFNLLKAIMYILASQLRILQRHVALEESKRRKTLGLTMSVTEVKIHTKRKKDYQESFDDLKPGSKRSKFILEDKSLKGQKPLDDRDHKSKATRESRGGKTATGKSPTSKFSSEDQKHFDKLDKDQKYTTKVSSGGKTTPRGMDEDEESKSTKKILGGKKMPEKSPTTTFPDKSTTIGTTSASKPITDKTTRDNFTTVDKYASDKSTGKSADKKNTSKFAADGHKSFDDLTEDQESNTPKKSSGYKTSTGKSPTSKFATEDNERMDDLNKDQDSKTTSKSPGGKISSGLSPTSTFVAEDQERLDDKNKNKESKTSSKSPGRKTSFGKSPTSKFATKDDESLDDENKHKDSKTTNKTPGGKTSSGISPTSKFVTENERLDDKSKDTDKSLGGKTTTGISPTSKLATVDEERLDDLKKDRDTKATSKSPGGKTSYEKSPVAKSTPDQSITIGTTSTDKSSSLKSTTEKSSTYKSSSEKSDTNDKSSTTKSTTEKTSTSKSISEKYSTSKSTSDKSPDKSTEKSSTQKSSSSKSSKRKSSDDDTTSKSKKKSSEKSSSSSSTRKKGGGGVGIGKKDKKSKKRSYGNDDEEDEDDDNDEDDSTMEILQEKLLLVSMQSSGTISDLTLATQEQYRELAKQIRKLQVVLGQSDTLGLLDSLHKTTSMTDPMAAINMATRLDVAEKQLAEMMSTVTEAAREISGIDLEAFDDTILKQAALKDWDAPGLSSQYLPDGQNLPAFKQPLKRRGKNAEEGDTGNAFQYDSDEESEAESLVQIPIDSSINYADRIELRRLTREIKDNLMKKADETIKQSAVISEDTYKKFKTLDEKIDAAMEIDDAFSDLECDVESYADKINSLDGFISGQLTLYQDTLTQMQFDLENGMDNFAEALARPNEDSNAVYAELNVDFNSFTLDLSNMLQRQKQLKDGHTSFALDLEALLKKIEVLREQKSTRDELADALSDKVGIAELNGIVPMQQFDAVHGDFTKKIRLAYDQINNKEFDWQRALDDVIRLINEKVDYKGLITLQNDIQKYLEVMKYDLDEMLAIVGDVSPNPTKKKLDRPGKCLSCGTNVNIEVNADVMECYMSQTTIVAPETTDSIKAKADSNICIPGRPIKHPIDPRSLICRNFCGAESSVPCNLDPFIIAEWKPSQSSTEASDRKENTVNFRLVRLILLILSNQLRILDRHVQISLVRAFKKAAVAPSNFSIAEVRVNTRTKKKKTKSSNKFKITQNITAAVAHFSTTSTIIRRFDSQDESFDSLTSSLETTSTEKILVVGSQGRSPQLVTRDEFDQLLNTVREIQDQIYPGDSGLEAEFEKALREGASFTSAMAALQISSRLESFENKLVVVFSLLTELAQFMPGINMRSVRELEQSINKLKLQSTGLRVEDEFDEDELDQNTSTVLESRRSTVYEGQEAFADQEPSTGEGPSADEEPFGITRPMLAVAMGHLRGDVIEHVKTFADTAQSNISSTKKKVTELEEKLEAALDLEDRMYGLEASIDNYGGEVSTIDAIISTKLTGYQDGITQMSLELETALDALEQTLSSTSADPEALAELGKKLTSMQYDIASTAQRYKVTDVAQKKLAFDLVQLGYEIEKVNDSKADRCEVADALRDKVGIGELNGMVCQEYYDAVRGELEKKIIASYHKFNDQELLWQTSINQLIKAINTKADRVSEALVHKDIERYIIALDDKVKVIADILGEPPAAATNKMVFREKECLSCSLSVPVNMKNSGKLPPLPKSRRSADGAEVTHLARDGDRTICYPGLPLPHQRDPRGDICQKHCGAQLTLPEIPRTQPGMTVSGMQRFTSGTAESDQTSEDSALKVRKPCVPCNKPEVNMASELGNFVSNSGNMTSAGWTAPRKTNSVSLTMRLPSLSD